MRNNLIHIKTALELIAGSDDIATPVAGLSEIAARVQGARLTVLGGAGHLAPAEAPELVAEIVCTRLLTTG